MFIVKIEADKNGFHLMQSQNHRTKCWLDGFIEVPKGLEKALDESGGYCDLEIKKGVLIGIKTRPELKPKTEKPITAENRLEALENALIETLSGTGETEKTVDFLALHHKRGKIGLDKIPEKHKEAVKNKLEANKSHKGVTNG